MLFSPVAYPQMSINIGLALFSEATEKPGYSSTLRMGPQPPRHTIALF